MRLVPDAWQNKAERRTATAAWFQRTRQQDEVGMRTIRIAATLLIAPLLAFVCIQSQESSAQTTTPSAPPSPFQSVTPGTAAAPGSTIEQKAGRTFERATKDTPWVNSLGMNFVPVPGIQVLFSIWDTRVQDFEMFVKSTNYDATGGIYTFFQGGWGLQRGATWKEPGFSQELNHPVVGVSYRDAEEFCKWLTQRERSAGDLPEEREYRLPTDEEWSAAVGLKNEVGSTPEEKNAKIKLYPWDIPRKPDKSWPPPVGAGNYAGEEAKTGDWPSAWPVIDGYNDRYPRTSPVGSFSANAFGLYDMGGNVFQLCQDWYNAEGQYHVLRGASWLNGDPDILLASYRGYDNLSRTSVSGFRCVLATLRPAASPGRVALASPSPEAVAAPNREGQALPTAEANPSPGRVALVSPSPEAVATPNREGQALPTVEAIPSPGRAVLAGLSAEAGAALGRDLQTRTIVKASPSPGRVALASPSPEVRAALSREVQPRPNVETRASPGRAAQAGPSAEANRAPSQEGVVSSSVKASTRPGRVTRISRIDQNTHTFTVQWMLPHPTSAFAHGSLSREKTFKTTDKTIYLVGNNRGSWFDLKRGASVHVTRHSEGSDLVADTVNIIVGP
jgi:formylglycine-generating enzyme required for sulfatase activity